MSGNSVWIADSVVFHTKLSCRLSKVLLNWVRVGGGGNGITCRYIDLRRQNTASTLPSLIRNWLFGFDGGRCQNIARAEVDWDWILMLVETFFNCFYSVRWESTLCALRMVLLLAGLQTVEFSASDVRQDETDSHTCSCPTSWQLIIPQLLWSSNIRSWQPIS